MSSDDDRPATASTASWASTTPYPYRVFGLSVGADAVARSARRISGTVRSLSLADSMSAIVPPTCGAAMLVPHQRVYPPV
jgi:hypothetical protein